MIKDFLIINCTGKNDQIGLRIDNNFFIRDFQTKFQNNEFVKTILNFITKHKVNVDKNFSILINYGPGSFSSFRIASLSVAKGIKISKNVKLFGYKESDLTQFNLENIENFN